MKRTLVALAMVLALSASPLMAQGEFALSFKPADRETARVFWPAQWFISNMARPASLLLGLPKELTGQAHYGMAVVDGHACVMVMALEGKQELYVDTDLDGDLADETPLAPQADGSDRGYGPVSVRLAVGDEARRISLYVRYIHEMHTVLSFPGGSWQGTAELGGRKFLVGVMDSDYNGCFIRPEMSAEVILSRRFDRFFIDRDGDGRFGADEVLPLPRLVNVGDAWYSLDLKADASAVTFRKTEPKLGTIDAGTPDVAMTLVSETGVHRLSGSGGRWQLPEGTYMPWGGIVLSAKDEDGAEWMLRTLPSYTPPVVAVEAGKTAELKLKPVAKVAVQKLDMPEGAGTTYIMGFSLEGEGGVKYYSMASKDKQYQPAPEIRIVNAEGGEIGSGKFTYG